MSWRYKFLLCALTLCSQHPALKAQLAVGFKGGAVFAQQERSDFATSLRSSGNVGLAVNLYAAEPFRSFDRFGFALQPEVLYSNKGGVVHQRDQAAHSDDRVEKLSYVEVPFGLIFLLNFGKVVPYVSAAPYYAFLVSHKSEFHEQGLDSYKRGDYGVKLGVGVELQKFQLSAAYSEGFCDVSLKSGKKIYNRGVEISLGYFFLNNY